MLAAQGSGPSRAVAGAIASRCSLAPRPSAAAPRMLQWHRRTPSVSHRSVSTSDDPQHPPPAVQVPPPPSWSVRDLRLTSTENDEISEEELATLARRCLIDVRRLSPARRDRLRSHVGGIVRCASVLLDARNLDVDNGEGGGNELTDEEVYDAPRGLGKMPMRREEDDWVRDSRESRAVLQSEFVQSKTIESDDGERFFSVVTKR